MHAWPANLTAFKGCVPPGQCTAPDSKYSRIVTGPVPGQQWNIAGGFCGAFSVQHAALGVGAWVSQDLVRKANRMGPGPHNMHGDKTEGYEVMPSNVAVTAEGLKLAYEEWDYSQPVPQAAAFKKWLKSQLVQGRAIAWFPMCKGDPHQGYPGSCPGGGKSGDVIGHVDHVEAMYGIFSNHPLDDPEVYDDDWIVHTSDQDYMPYACYLRPYSYGHSRGSPGPFSALAMVCLTPLPLVARGRYYRPFNSLEDTSAMEGNCAKAGRGFGKNEMYPCFDEKVSYALAVKGLAVNGTTYPVAITTDVRLMVSTH